MGQDQETYQRARMAAIYGLLVQLLLTVVVGLLALWSESWTVGAAFFHMLGGLPIWVILWMVYHQHRLERMEALESEQLARADARTAALFEEQADELALARRRLGHLLKWGLSSISLALAAYLTIIGLWLGIADYRLLQAHHIDPIDLPPGGNAALVMVGFGAALGFVAFIMARYLAGMTRVKEWQLLRGGAGYLMGNACALWLLVVGAIFAQFDRPMVFAALGAVIPALLAVVGVEIILNAVLAAYRPRLPGETPRPAFDSRLLGWMTSPESLAKIVSDTLNYQFGFEVSRSWFYRLLGRALAPLLALGLLCLVLISSVVVIGPEEQGILRRCGAIADQPLDPGIHLKPPWPFGDVQRVEVGRIHEVLIGSSTAGEQPDKAILWTNQHMQGEEEYLVTAPTQLQEEIRRMAGAGAAVGAATQPTNTEMVAGMLLAARVSVQYRITDARKYVLAAAEPEQLLTILADRCLNAYFATQSVDALMGSARTVAGRELQERIQAQADLAQLGVRIVFVGLMGIHPPQDKGVAESFHDLVRAEEERQNIIQAAEQDAIKALAGIAGSREAALEIDAAIRAYEKLSDALSALRRAAPPDAAASAAKEAEVRSQAVEIDKLLTRSRGQGGVLIAQARALRWERSAGERAKAERFTAELAAYRKSPRYYMARQYLDAFATGLENARKYILGTAASAPPLLKINLQDTGFTPNFDTDKK